MNKAVNIYWDSTHATRRAKPRKARPRAGQTNSVRVVPTWLAYVFAISIFVMLSVSINYRVFTQAQEESGRHVQLTAHIQNLQDETLALQEEIYTLKTDPKVIQREARRIGIDLSVVRSSRAGE